jgi:hypothetical protein
VSVVDKKTIEALKPGKLSRHFKEQFRVNVTTTSLRCRFDIRIRGIATNGENRPQRLLMDILENLD